MSIGLISFAAVAQFAPALLGGLYWKGGTRARRAGRAAAPASRSGSTRCCCRRSRKSGWLPTASCRTGRSASRCCGRYALFGLDGLDQITHALFWSLLANVGAYVAVSLSAQQPVRTSAPGDAVRRRVRGMPARARRALWRGTASVPDLRTLLGALSRARAGRRGLRRLRRSRRGWRRPSGAAGRRASWCTSPRRQLAGAIGARLGAGHGGLGGQGGAARPRRGACAILDEASQVHGLQPRARAEVAGS